MKALVSVDSRAPELSVEIATKERNRAIIVSNVTLSGAKSALVFTIGSRRIKITMRWHWNNFESKTLKTF